MSDLLNVLPGIISSFESDSEIYDLVANESGSDDELIFNELIYISVKPRRHCIKGYLEEIVPSYTEEEFRRHFRISKSLLLDLCDKFQMSNMYMNLRADKRFPAYKYIAIFLWFAGHEACSYRDLADRFDLSLSSVCRIMERAITFISSLSLEVIKWPNEERKQKSNNVFLKNSGFSKAIGCIDGTHITIDPPNKCKDDYIDRKGCTSICLQAICNENKKFINIFVGFPGSSHDSWIFKNSSIGKKLAAACGDHYLLGDSAYACTKHLVTPYRDNGHLTRAQKNFNIKLSSSRVAIEHTFGILKQRFRQLYYCKLKGSKKLCHFIRACCVLHNIANENDLDFTTEDLYENSSNTEELEYGETARGNSVRDPICTQLQQ